MKKLLPKRKPERKPSEEDFTVRKSKYAVYHETCGGMTQEDGLTSLSLTSVQHGGFGDGIPELGSELGSWILFLAVDKYFCHSIS